MTNQEIAARHWSSKYKREQRIQKILREEDKPYALTIKYGDSEFEILAEIRDWLGQAIPDKDWNNQSMLIRQIIKMAWAKVLETKENPI